MKTRDKAVKLFLDGWMQKDIARECEVTPQRIGQIIVSEIARKHGITNREAGRAWRRSWGPERRRLLSD